MRCRFGVIRVNRSAFLWFEPPLAKEIRGIFALIPNTATTPNNTVKSKQGMIDSYIILIDHKT